MEQNLKIGINKELNETVTEKTLASTYGSGAISVFSTPHMIALMEKTSMEAVNDYLEEGQATVGIGVYIEHINASALGMNIKTKATLTEIDKRILTFDVFAYNNIEMIGKGTHKRAIIDQKKFMDKLEEKINTHKQ